MALRRQYSGGERSQGRDRRLQLACAISDLARLKLRALHTPGTEAYFLPLRRENRCPARRTSTAAYGICVCIFLSNVLRIIIVAGVRQRTRGDRGACQYHIAMLKQQ